MIRINLLPHREEARKTRRQQLFVLMGGVVLIGGLIVFFIYSVIGSQVDSQQEKNDFLSREIAALDKEIAEISRLKEQTQALLSRKQVIESLQADRGETVHLLNEFVRQVPEGIYLKSLRQDGNRINLAGYAQSSARVSALMRNFEASPWMEKPDLVEVKAVMIDKRRLNEFGMNITVSRNKAESGSKGAK